jgi:hypothetical protein
MEMHAITVRAVCSGFERTRDTPRRGQNQERALAERSGREAVGQSSISIAPSGALMQVRTSSPS